MAKYCPNCGRSIPDDGQVCPYCGKLIAFHQPIQVLEPEEKKDRTALIIAVVVLILVLTPIIMSAAMYIYISNLIGSMPPFTPIISLSKNSVNHTLTVVYVSFSSSSLVRWSDIDIQGICNTSGLGPFVTEGDIIMDCEGSIRLIYTPSNTLIGSWDFTSSFVP
ncbi:MAG: zinc-ribbon domain-containing protein [Methanobacteriota archaeon]